MLIQAVNLQKTYQMGSVQVHALKDAPFRLKKESSWRSSGRRAQEINAHAYPGCLASRLPDVISEGQDVSAASDDELADPNKNHFVFQQFNLLPKATIFRMSVFFDHGGSSVACQLSWAGFNGRTR